MSQRSIRLDKGSITVRLRGAIGRILSLGGKNDPPPNPPLAKGRESQPVQRFHETPTRLALEKGGNRIGSPPFEGGFRGIELELEATPPTLKYARGDQPKGGIGGFQAQARHLPLDCWFSMEHHYHYSQHHPRINCGLIDQVH